jgi:ribosomal protein S18 acetylase RimI-like enzyme
MPPTARGTSRSNESPRSWTTTLLPQKPSRGLYAETTGGVPVGSVGLAERVGDPEVGVIVLIGVLPQQRGHGYVDQLLLAAYRAARMRGFAAALSFVDVNNHPMMAAIRHSGATPNAHPRHK